MPDVPAARFRLDAPVVACEPVAGGHIHHSYRVETQSGRQYLLQHINRGVFLRPEAMMHNIALVTAHLAGRLQREGVEDPRRSLHLVPTRDGAWWLTLEDAAVWRMFDFAEGTVTRARVATPAEAAETGRAFGRFAGLLADYAGPALAITIPGFHDTAARLQALETIAAADPAKRAAQVGAELSSLLRRGGLARALPPAGTPGGPPLRLAHHDAKAANVLFDARSGEALCVIDLDTVMPGTILHDFGDLVRSCTSPTEEDEPDLARVGVRPELYRGLVRGYLEGAGPLLTSFERAHLGLAGRVITFEQAVRFLTDYLAGDTYYRVRDPEQNLRRCRTQIRLLETLEDHAEDLERAAAGDTR